MITRVKKILTGDNPNPKEMNYLGGGGVASIFWYFLVPRVQ